MSSKRRLRKRGCTNKARFKDKLEAIHAATKLRYDSGVRNYKPYQCKFSAAGHEHWHIGRPKQYRRPT